MVLLGIADRLLIAFGLTLLVLIVFIIVVCKVSPLCWLYYVCPLTKEDDEKKAKKKLISDTNARYEIRPLSPKKKKKMKTTEKTDSFGTPCIVPVQTAVKPVTEDKVNSDSSEVNGLLRWGQIKFTLQFNKEDERLIVKIIEVDDLSSGLLQGTNSLYIKIFILNSKGQSRSEINLTTIANGIDLPQNPTELQTKIVKKTNLPLIFDETFAINMAASDVKNAQLRLQSLQFDKFSHSNIIGQVMVALKDLDLSKELVMWKEFKKYEQELGDILISLSYLPTSERLSVTVIKAKNLKAVSPGIGANPLIKVALSHGKNLLNVRKTSVRVKELNPTFNENLYFDIPKCEMDRVILTIYVVHKEHPDEDSSEKLTIGKVKLGHCIMGSAQRHWKEMTLAPRKSIAKWYSLY